MQQQVSAASSADLVALRVILKRLAERGRLIRLGEIDIEDMGYQAAGESLEPAKVAQSEVENADCSAGSEPQSAGCGSVDESAIDILQQNDASREAAISETQ
jgi:hypothetical protein